MSAPFLSALGDLESKVEAAEAHLARLSAALPVDDPTLIRAFQDSCQHANALAALIHAERPQAQWDDREALDSLVLELEEEAEAKHDQQRRARLLDLAEELEAGRVRHRFEARTTQLNALREDAARELRAQAAVAGAAKELPGPAAREWLTWASNLKDDEDEAIVTRLQRDFAALETFTGEMEEIYWVPPQRSRPLAAPPVVPQASVGGSTFSPSAEGDNGSAPTRNPFDSAMPDGAHDSTFASAYERNPSRPPASGPHSPVEVTHQWESMTATLPVEPVAKPAGAVPVNRCERCGVSYNGNHHTCTVEAPTQPPAAVTSSEATVAVPAPAVAEPVAPAVAEAPHPGNEAPNAASPSAPATESADGQVAATEHTEAAAEIGRPGAEERSLLDVLTARMRSKVAWVGVGSFVILSALFFAVLHHLHERSSKPTTTVQASTAGTGSAATDPDATGEAASPANSAGAAANPNGRPPLLHKQPAEGAQDSIALSLEQCGRGPEHIECWGYVSNQGNAGSQVSLDRVDVVDGRGNSFSLVRNGQFAFPTGVSSSIAAGDRVKYTVKIPDKDLDARTLTLYMDLSNPRSLEYTFRDIPIVR